MSRKTNRSAVLDRGLREWLLVGTLPALASALVLLSCSNGSAPSDNESNSAGTNKAKSDNASVNPELTLDFADLPADARAAPLAAAGKVSLVGDNLLSGFSAVGAGTVKFSAAGAIESSTVVALPASLAGQTLLPVAEGGKDFWLIRKVDKGIEVIRPKAPLTALPLTALPAHSKVQLLGNAEVLGYTANFVVLKNASSLWFVLLKNGKLEASEIPFNDVSSLVAAGGVSSGPSSFWVSSGSSIWSLRAEAGNWSSKSHALKIKNASSSLSALAAVFSISSNGTLSSSGYVLAKFGNTLKIAGAKPGGGGGPIVTPSPTATGTPLTPLSFAEARAKCEACHATASTNTNAKARLNAIENITTWVNNKAVILGSVRDDVMPIQKLQGVEKERFLLFANDPKP